MSQEIAIQDISHKQCISPKHFKLFKQVIAIAINEKGSKDKLMHENQSHPMSVCLSVCLSLSLSPCLSVCLSVSPLTIPLRSVPPSWTEPFCGCP